MTVQKKISLALLLFSLALAQKDAGAVSASVNASPAVVPSKSDNSTDSADSTDDIPQGLSDTSQLDPLEPVNRAIFAFNNLFDKVILVPVSTLYEKVVPDPTKECVGNFLDNLFSPVTFIANILQGKPDHAMETLGRFMVNSTMGLLGAFDAGQVLGLQNRTTTFNETFASWGIETGPYLMIPFLGPTTFRGGFGMAADWYGNPVNYLVRPKKWLYLRQGITVLHKRAELLEPLQDVEDTALDYYLAIRNFYLQLQQQKTAQKKEKKNQAKKQEKKIKK